MHNAKLEKSARLQRVLGLLRNGPKTTMEIQRRANVCAVGTIISEIRANSIPVKCECIRKGVYQYSLESQN